MIVWLFTFLLVLVGGSDGPSAQSALRPMSTGTSRSHRIGFYEPATGGVITLVAGHRAATPCQVSVTTQPGEAGATVVSRLYSEASANPCFIMPGGRCRLDGDALVLPGREASAMFYLAGTETGLGIPSPPLFLSGQYDGERVHLAWQNPPGGYDAIAVAALHLCLGEYEGHSESAVLPVEGRLEFVMEMSRGHPHIYVVGYRNHLPSNAGVVRLSPRTQGDGPNTLFTGSVKPNWESWLFGENGDDLILEEDSEVFGVFHTRDSSGQRILMDNVNYFQRVHVRDPNVQGGIYRKFVDLTPGETYRVKARLSTFDMDDATEEWSYSFHACPGYPDGRDFTAEQFAGVGPLPDGTKGRDAARVVAYGPDYTTEGQCVEISTGDKGFPGQTIGDITLPEDVTEIVLWIRHTGTDTSGVGLDWVRLEDLSVTGG